MLNHLSTIAFSTAGRPPCTLDEMHDSAKRLYQAAERMRRVVGQSNVARLLNESPQTVKNWESRGVSDSGAIKAEGIIGCRAYWISTGEGDMAPRDAFAVRRTNSEPPTPAQIADALSAVSPEHSDEIADVVSRLIRTGSPAYRLRLAELLTAAPDAGVSVSPRQIAS